LLEVLELGLEMYNFGTSTGSSYQPKSLLEVLELGLEMYNFGTCTSSNTIFLLNQEQNHQL
jgi:hypothetical protein